MFFAATADIRLARGLVAWRAVHARFFVSRISGLLAGNRMRGRQKFASLAACRRSLPDVPWRCRSPFMSPGSEDDVAGSVPKWSFAGLLDAEDWRRAKVALSTALDPQGNGSLVGWDNPDTGNKGSFTPVGKPLPLAARICRAFLAEVDCKGDEHVMQGTACSDKRGEWTSAVAKPWKNT
jgi:surface antigen